MGHPLSKGWIRMLVKVMIFLLSPSPPPQLSRCCPTRGGAFTPEGRKGACECLASQVGGSLCVLGSWSLCSRQQCRRCSSGQQDQDLAGTLDSPSWAGITHLWRPPTPGLQCPFQPLTLSQRTRPQRAIDAMSSGPWRADLLYFCPPPAPTTPPHHPSKP